MEKERGIAYYIVRWYGRLMSPIERRAQSHLFAAMKATLGRSDAEAQREARESTTYSRFLSDDAAVLHLTSAGYEAFIQRTAARILEDCPDDVFFNRCPKCGGLARTPAAKHCHFCSHDWHGKNQLA